MNRILIFLAAAAASSSSVAGAQTVARDPLVERFGACAARQLEGHARALMATPIDSPAEQRAARRLAESRSGCVDRRLATLTMLTGEFRGAVAEGLIERDPEAVVRLKAMPPRPAVRPAPADGRAFVVAYARCIADANPARAAGLFDVSPASPEHRAAFLAFGEVLSDCMPLGQRYRLDTFDVRNHIAMRLYDLAYPGAAAAR